MTDLQHKLDILDQQIIQEIMVDMTLLMMLEMVAVNKELYRSQGVIIGES